MFKRRQEYKSDYKSAKFTLDLHASIQFVSHSFLLLYREVLLANYANLALSDPGWRWRNINWFSSTKNAEDNGLTMMVMGTSCALCAQSLACVTNSVFPSCACVCLGPRQRASYRPGTKLTWTCVRLQWLHQFGAPWKLNETNERIYTNQPRWRRRRRRKKLVYTAAVMKRNENDGDEWASWRTNEPEPWTKRTSRYVNIYPEFARTRTTTAMARPGWRGRWW